jgi:tetratricopeptide (TPR) repeat protein
MKIMSEEEKQNNSEEPEEGLPQSDSLEAPEDQDALLDPQAPEDALLDQQEQGEELVDGEEEEDVEFDLEAQIEEFRLQIKEEPENSVHHYNLGEALSELGDEEEALCEFDMALEYDTDKEFSAIINYAIGDVHFRHLISGIQGTVVRSSVGLHSAHKPGDSITEVHAEDYELPIGKFEAAIENLVSLNADEEIVEYVSKSAPQRIADTYYKWGSDLIDKSRQISKYGGETKDVQESLKHLKKTLEIDGNHSQASLMVKYAKKMLQEGWVIYDENGFEAKKIEGNG